MSHAGLASYSVAGVILLLHWEFDAFHADLQDAGGRRVVLDRHPPVGGNLESRWNEFPNSKERRPVCCLVQVIMYMLYMYYFIHFLLKVAVVPSAWRHTGHRFLCGRAPAPIPGTSACNCPPTHCSSLQSQKTKKKPKEKHVGANKKITSNIILNKKFISD